MGWSYTKAAGDVLAGWEKKCLAQSGSQNVYGVGSSDYFFEVDCKDQPDGGIKGDVIKIMPGLCAKQVGIFKIAGNGEVLRAPVGLR